MNNNRKKYEEIALQIEKSIIQGKYKPGDRLPPERVLAEEYGVSRSILREAVKHIAAMGLVRIEPQSGSYVTDYGKEASLELLVYLMDNSEPLDPLIVRSLLELRELMETGIAERAAPLSDDAFIEELKARHSLMCGARNDPEKLAQLDYHFHSAVTNQTGNIAFKLLFNACRSVYLFYAREFYKYPEHTEHTLIQLENLIEAMRLKNSSDARNIMKAALSYGRARIYETLKIGTASGI